MKMVLKATFEPLNFNIMLTNLLYFYITNKIKLSDIKS